ncbi:MAG: hypothetical protein R3Y63_09350 [Eubacteriales bacterium]
MADTIIDINTVEAVDGVLTAKVDGILKRIMPETKGTNVEITVSDGQGGTTTTTLAAVIATIITDLGETPTSVSMEKYVDDKMNELIGGAPEDGNDMLELFNLIKTNKDAMTLLTEGQLNKVDKVTGSSLVKDTVIAIIETITTGKIEAWDLAQENKLEKFKVNGVVQNIASGDKSVDITMPVISVVSEVPATDAPDGLYFVTK